MKLKKYKDFISEEVSGTELVGPVGPAYGETRLQNKTINTHDTNIIYSNVANGFYTIDEYNELYNEYLKLGGTEVEDEFTEENIDKILYFMNKGN